MYISNSDKELILKHILSKKSKELKTKSISEIIERSIEEMTVEDAKEILKVSKKYSDNEDIDVNKNEDVIKVLVRYICRLCSVFYELKYPYASSQKSYDYYTSKIKYHTSTIDELKSDEFTYSKMTILLAVEKILTDYQELSNCHGLEIINEYIRNNIYSITIRKIERIIENDIRSREFYIQNSALSRKNRRG